MTDPKVYPLTAAFEKFLEDRLKAQKPGVRLISNIAEILKQTLGEYEHGTADAIDLMPPEFINLFINPDEGNDMALVIYKNVLEDVFLILQGWDSSPRNHP